MNPSQTHGNLQPTERTGLPTTVAEGSVPSPAVPDAKPSAGSAKEQDGTLPVAARKKAEGSWLKKAILGVAAVGVVAATCYFGIPWIVLAFTTVSTDDSYVNGHATFVAARVAGQVTEVLTDDNKPVFEGQVIVRLDRVPYQVQVNLKNAILETAKADFEVAQTQVRAGVAQARGSRFKLEHAMEAVNDQVGQLRATFAGLEGDLATRERALRDFERIKELVKTTPEATSKQDVDLKRQDFQVAQSKVRQTVEKMNQIRAGLGLATIHINADDITKPPASLVDTPKDLDQTFSSVRQAVADVMQNAAPLGVSPSSFDLTPRRLLDEFLERDPEKNLDRIYQGIIKKAPAIAQAKAKVDQAQRDLDVANLNLSYCDVKAEIDGVVTRRNVNPGNNVQAGQSLMAIRSLTEIWIDANFKETQLANLRIGQRTKIEVDMYGSRKEYEGRITGFTMGTGQTLSLLPPQNATGNFVKIVQRLPVKVELINYNPYKDPLFLGLSCTPYVYIHDPLIENDPGKGEFLQPLLTKGIKR
jgi:membrane fusion protein, multidrug efflux system